MVHRLCIDHEGNYIRRPGEVIDLWTLDEVLEAHDVMDWLATKRKRLTKPRPKKSR